MKGSSLVLVLLLVLAGVLLCLGKIRDGEQNPATHAKRQNTESSNLSKIHTQELANRAEVNQKVAKLHIPFIVNQGQIDDRVKFYASMFGGTVFVTNEGEIVYSLPKVEGKKEVETQDFASLQSSAILNSKPTKVLALKEELVRVKAKEIKAEGEIVTRVSYFIGNDQSKWKSNISTYETVSLG